MPSTFRSSYGGRHQEALLTRWVAGAEPKLSATPAHALEYISFSL